MYQHITITTMTYWKFKEKKEMVEWRKRKQATFVCNAKNWSRKINPSFTELIHVYSLWQWCRSWKNPSPKTDKHGPISKNTVLEFSGKNQSISDDHSFYMAFSVCPKLIRYQMKTKSHRPFCRVRERLYFAAFNTYERISYGEENWLANSPRLK